MQLQVFETFVSSNPQICAYDCHIAPKGEYPEFEKDHDNIVFASWDFHNHFDGLNVRPKKVPPTVIIPVKSYVETDVEVNGHVYKRRRIDVIIFRVQKAARLSVVPLGQGL
jgi:hypothetical protein